VDGAYADPPRQAPGRVIDPVGSIAIVVHSGYDPRSARSVLRAATPVLEHARLQAELSLQLVEVRASRARLVLAADAERRRIERDLHDGAQQRLIGLALHIQSARRRGTYPSEVNQLLGFVVDELRAGVGDIRGLVYGLLPPALAAGGIPAAIGDLARRGEVFVTCEVSGRLAPSIEATAWFVACEGIANASKHAPGTPIEVHVSATDRRLLVRVADSGPGGADPHGDGLRHLADRVEAHGGSLHVDSPIHGGTTLLADLPCGS
jgi:signal transduction histidine kinase